MYIYIHTYITLHYITLHYITLHYITLHTYTHTYIHTYIHYITWHDMTWHYITWHDMTWHDITIHYITLHTYIHIYIYIYVYIYIYIYIYTFIYTYINIIHVYIYTYLNAQFGDFSAAPHNMGLLCGLVTIRVNSSLPVAGAPPTSQLPTGHIRRTLRFRPANSGLTRSASLLCHSCQWWSPGGEARWDMTLERVLR